MISKLQSLISKFLNNNTDLKDLQEAVLFYKDILSQYETFNAEFKICVQLNKKIYKKKTTKLRYLLGILSEISFDFFFQTCSILQILTTLPVTTITA